jgi:hypothetical protein
MAEAAGSVRLFTVQGCYAPLHTRRETAHVVDAHDDAAI